jgi:hypothetical protein
MSHRRIDIGRVASTALATALEDERPRRHGHPLRAMAAGAALVVAARAAVKKTPGLPHLDDLAELPENLRDRLADRGWLGDRDEDYDEPEDVEYDEEDEDFDEEDEDVEEEDEDVEEPEAEEDEGPEDDEVDEPEAEADEDEGPEDEDDDEPEDDEPEDEPAAEEEPDDELDEDEESEAPELEVPRASTRNGGRRSRTADLMAVLAGHRAPPPVLDDTDAPDPVDRPPRPPKRARRGKTSSSRSTSQRRRTKTT